MPRPAKRELYPSTRVNSIARNEVLILDTIYERPGLSTRQLALATGLSYSTVRKLCYELLDDGLLVTGKTRPCCWYLVDI